jgi:hypothetical protein
MLDVKSSETYMAIHIIINTGLKTVMGTIFGFGIL